MRDNSVRTVSFVFMLAALSACSDDSGGSGGSGGGTSTDGIPTLTKNVSPAALNSLSNNITMDPYGFSQGVKYDATGTTNADFANNSNLPRIRRVQTKSGDDTYKFYFNNSEITVETTLIPGDVRTARTNQDTFVMFRTVSGTFDYTAAGAWSMDRSARSRDNLMGPFSFGIETQISGLQALGALSATYTGKVAGEYRNATDMSGVTGDLSMDVTFSPTQQVNTTITNGSVTNMVLVDLTNTPLNDLSFSGTGTGSSFDSMTVTVGAATGNAATDLNPGDTGPIVGHFFGPNAQEVGVSFRVTDQANDRALVGGGAAVRP